MTFRRPSFISPASSARLAVSSGVSSSRALSGEHAESRRAQGCAPRLAAAGVWASAGRQLSAAAAGVCVLLLGVYVPAYAQSVSFTGAQTTVPASGLLGPDGVAVDGAGDVFIVDTGNHRVVEVPAGGGAQTTVGTGLSYPQGVAVDGAGDVFIVDNNNNRVVGLSTIRRDRTRVPAVA